MTETVKQKRWLAFCAFALVVAMWMGRYELQPTSQGITAYQLDRWTGKVALIRVDRYSEISSR